MHVTHRFINDLPLYKLKPYGNNPRVNKDAVKYVAGSIKDFNFLNPILIDENFEILAGHTRLEAARSLNMTTAPAVIIEGLTEQQKKAFRIADNKAGEFSQWDFEKLAEEIKGIDWGELSPEDWGLVPDKILNDLKERENWQEILNDFEQTAPQRQRQLMRENENVARVLIEGPREMFPDDFNAILEQLKRLGLNVRGDID